MVVPILILVLEVTPASAAGVDSLRETAKQALAQNNPAQAVADLRRARVSILAESKDDTLRAELSRSETVWLAELLRLEMQRAAPERVPHLLALRAEATRIENSEGARAAARSSKPGWHHARAIVGLEVVIVGIPVFQCSEESVVLEVVVGIVCRIDGVHGVASPS